METSLKKLQKFAALRHDKRSQKKHLSLAHDELARATQDMIDMRDCYDRLLAAAAATANSVYEFSESLREMGDCLLEKTALSDDEESGKVLLMLGKGQFELQKLVDSYRSHVVRTITAPSESLLNELHIVEEMKRRCDEKREIYEAMMKQKEKGKLRNNKGESFNSHQLQEAKDEYDEEANIFVFRMKSLKQGQSHSFLTQASRHHAAQLCFFKKALRSLEAIEPHVRLVAEQQHIDYQFSALKDDSEVVYDDDDGDDDDEDEDGKKYGIGDSDMENDSKGRPKGELSFEFGRSGPLHDISASKSVELDNMDRASSPDTKIIASKEILQNPVQNSTPFQEEARAISTSAPLFPAKINTQAERTQLQPSASRKFISYVLPTPEEMKSPASRKFDSEAASQTREATTNLWHSSPLGNNKYEKIGANEKLSGPIIFDTHSVLKESNNIKKSSPLPPPLSDALFFKQDDPSIASHAKKIKRQAFSGPLTDKPWTASSPNLSASGPITSSRYPPPFSGSLLRTPFPRPASTPKLSSRITPKFASTPKISELHELPRPPSHLAPKRTADRITHSGPIISKSHELYNARLVTTSAASALTMLPPTLPRSYSIPAGGPNEMALRVPLEGSQNIKIEDISSPPLTPIRPENIDQIISQPASQLKLSNLMLIRE